MENLFEQPMKMMEQNYTQWKKVMENHPLMDGNAMEEYRKNAASWLSIMKESYQSNVASWDRFLDQYRETCFQVYKNSPFHNQSSETIIRNAWNDMVTTRKKYQEIVKESLEKLHTSLADVVDTRLEWSEVVTFLVDWGLNQSTVILRGQYFCISQFPLAVINCMLSVQIRSLVERRVKQ